MDTIYTLKPEDPNYPPLLTQVITSPPLLYIRGSVACLNLPTLSVIGSRRITPYTKTILPKLLTPAIDAGLVIVSGLAYGVDSEAQRCAVQARKPTIAVLGGSIADTEIYPRTHVSLVQNIIKHGGAIISEYPPGSTIYKSNFIARNRIIAALSPNLLVVACAKKSGSLTTVDFALQYNRNVYAVPGPVFSFGHIGTNELIKQGAGVITDPQDILDLYGLTQAGPHKNSPSPDLLVQLIHAGNHTLEELQEKSGLPTSLLLSKLTQLELKKIITKQGINYYTQNL